MRFRYGCFVPNRTKEAKRWKVSLWIESSVPREKNQLVRQSGKYGGGGGGELASYFSGRPIIFRRCWRSYWILETTPPPVICNQALEPFPFLNSSLIFGLRAPASEMCSLSSGLWALELWTSSPELRGG